jgi:hypothetical protein
MGFSADSTGVTDRRGRMPAVPTNVGAMLNQDQKNALRKVENFGWQLAFVRRPAFQTPMFVVQSPDGVRHALLEGDGQVDMNPSLVLRH